MHISIAPHSIAAPAPGSFLQSWCNAPSAASCTDGSLSPPAAVQRSTVTLMKPPSWHAVRPSSVTTRLATASKAAQRTS
eukprot:6766093-Prymnesium_polylepis.1